MDHEKLAKRRMRLLTELAAKAKGRTDAKLALSEIAPTLKFAGRLHGPTFDDTSNPDGDSELAYDFSTLHSDGLIKPTYLDQKRGDGGETIYSNPGIQITSAGFQAVSDANRSWLSKSIEKQPITFLQIVLTVIIALLSFLGGLWLGGR